MGAAQRARCRGGARLAPLTAVSFCRIAFLWWAVLLCLAAGQGEAWSADEPVAVRLRTTAQEALLELRIAPGWHVNAHRPGDEFLIPTSVTFTPPAGVLVGSVAWPAPEERRLAFSGEKPLQLYSGTVQLVAPLSGTAAPGAPPLVATVRYQACNDTICLPPKTVEVAASPEPQAVISRYDDPGQANVVTATVERYGWGLTLSWIVLVGLALNLTPCVYPMISVTIAFFGGRTGDDTARAVRHALVYLLGICLAFSGLGATAALTGSLFGAALQRPAVLGAIALLMLVLALANFGLYQLRMPSGVLLWAGRGGEGAFGAFVMGLTMGIVGAPCIGPIVAALVLYVGAQQSIVLGVVLFLALGLGLGLPYVLLAAMAGRLRRVLPRGGPWLQWVEWLFGFVLLGAALHFATPLLDASVVRWAWGVLLAAAGIALGFLDWRTGVAARRLRQVLGAILLAAAASSVVSPGPERQIAWEPLTDTALASAAVAGRPVLIDFQAEWCLPCREMERSTFQDAGVVRAAAAFVTLRADLTVQDAEADAVMARWRIAGVPTYVFLDRRGRERRRLVGFVAAEDFLAALREAAAEDGAG